MNYLALQLLHLFAALFFVGTVFFEVLMLEAIRSRVPRDAMRLVEGAIGHRARQLMPWVILVLYSAGVGLAWHHRGALAAFGQGAMGFWLSVKIVLALSVFGHFLTAMVLARRRRLNARRGRLIHISVFCHVVVIVVLAKSMFYLHAW